MSLLWSCEVWTIAKTSTNQTPLCRMRDGQRNCEVQQTTRRIMGGCPPETSPMASTCAPKAPEEVATRRSITKVLQLDGALIATTLMMIVSNCNRNTANALNLFLANKRRSSIASRHTLGTSAVGLQLPSPFLSENCYDT